LFDGEHENLRCEISEEYKANRPGFEDTPEEENPFSQLPDIYSALDFMGVCHTEIYDVEVDDVIASYAFTYGENMRIVISSFDSDFFQLINNNVSVLRYRGNKTSICDEDFLHNKFGVLPSQYADFKSLTGDTADNIRGADKVGPKTAAALINQFGSLKAVIDGADEITKPSIRESIKQNTERLKTNYRLIKLDNTAPIPFGINKLLYTYNGARTVEILERIGIR
jgi:DNA polymerase-1